MSDSRHVAVLLGGGVESTLLVRQFLAADWTVSPVHLNTGLIWDDCEARWTRLFCEAFASPRLHPLLEINLPLQDFLRGHWAVTGIGVPPAGAASADLEIPLRNLTLLGFALHRLKRGHTKFALAMGTTSDNHYNDGSRAYFDACERVLSLEAGWPVQILTPLIDIDKTAVIRRSDRETLALSFSCVNPQQNQHCGRCIKCGRRQEAFELAGVEDPTVYAHRRQ